LRKPLIIHPLLFSVFPILFLFSHNIEQLPINEMLIPIAVTACFALASWALLSAIFKNTRKAGLLVSLFLVLFFSYGHFFNALEGFQLVIGRIIIGRNKILFPMWGILFLLGAYFSAKTPRDLYTFTNLLNIVSAFLVGISLINIVGYKLKTRVAWQDIKSTETIETNISYDRKPDTLRDIYYIIFDRYASADTLKDIYDFDNGEFIKYLSQKGFHVAHKSRSNYIESGQSLASSLNMEFINYLCDKVGEESNDRAPIHAMLQDYRVWRFLKSRGYKFIHLGSWWGPTSKNRYADKNINYCLLPEFSMLLYKSTLFYPIGDKLGFNERREQWKRALYKFDKLAEIPNIREPTFVFAHMLIPHDPYVFDEEGKFLSWAQVEKRDEKENYRRQLIFANKKVKELIDKILLNSEVPPIIILQADEGPYPQRYKLHGDDFNWKNATDAELREKTGIFNAYYLPNVDTKILYPSITPVNSFRLVFNLYFNTHFELLPDETYAFVDSRHPYNLFNVTDKVK